ncbi:MAG TPA: adenylate/guanylate cyclase domain-containing protein [Burkholderiales bacterium]|nr:adenylate/guanylate cyclase domain-containing protein [Burkholderiales bacterium]
MADPELNIQSVLAWLDAGAPEARRPEDVLNRFCRALLAGGISLHRVAVFVRTLHPNVAGRGFFWRADREEVEVDSAEHGWFGTEEHLKSPIYAVWTRNTEVRRRLADPNCPLDYPVLEDLRAEGVTDYLAVPLRFLNGEVHVATFATRRLGGFSETEVAALRRLLPPFTRLTEIYANMRKAQNILDAYLGASAGEKVLAGRIKRGDSEDIDAVIWFCDLRDSTALADSMGRREFLALLNDYFECVLGPVLERGGLVLRFIGDAALAIFPVDGKPAEACAKALAAAREALARMEKLNKARPRPLRFGIGLHLGELTYGNIGTPTRIEFTVVGAAANEAARIESLCKHLDADLLVSERVARTLPGVFRPLGSHTLRGVGAKMELFTVQEEEDRN